MEPVLEATMETPLKAGTAIAPHESAVADDKSLAVAGPIRRVWGARPWVLLITVLAGILRMLYLASQGMIPDEGFSIYLGRISSAEFVRIVWGSEFNMVLYYMLLRFWMHLGQSEFLIRMLGVVLATATVPVVYLLGKRLFDERVAMLAALMLAVHPAHLMLAQRARSYPLRRSARIAWPACVSFAPCRSPPGLPGWLTRCSPLLPSIATSLPCS